MTCLQSHIPIYSNLILFNDSNGSKYVSHLIGMNYRAKTGNDVSKFMHLNWIMPSY